MRVTLTTATATKLTANNMSRAYNFGAGPAMLPAEVMLRAQSEFLNWQNTGMSVMEISHRGPEFGALIEQIEANFRSLLNIPENYQVLFLHGGASHQFGMVPINCLHNKADYLVTGIWSEKAAKEAVRYGRLGSIKTINAQCINDEGLRDFVDADQWSLSADADYLHYTPNETIGGLEFHQPPKVSEAPLIGDFTSSLLSEPLNIEDYGLIYAGAQKNVGMVGLTVVIVREDLIGQMPGDYPILYDYAEHVKSRSLYNTAPTYPWYMAGLVFDWLIEQGGLKVMAERNLEKSSKLYDYIDTSEFYNNDVAKRARSRMNVPFTLADESLNQAFLDESNAAGLLALKGHRSVGGMRASIYNAMPVEAIDALIEFMQAFENKA